MPDGRDTDAVSSNLLKVVATLGTTAGLLTIVAGTGGGLVWARFSSAGLPADQALSLVERNDLVAAGAVRLGLFVVLAVITVAGVASNEEGKGKATRNMRLGLCAMAAAELVLVAFIAMPTTARIAATSIVTVVLFAVACYIARKGWPAMYTYKPQLRKYRTDKPEAGGPARRWWWQVRRLFWWLRTFPKLPDGPGQTQRPKLHWWACALLLLATAAMAVWFAYLAQDGSRPGLELSAGGAVLLAGALAGLCFGIADSSQEDFWPYGLAVFFSVIIFGAVFTTWRNFENPKMSPVGLLRLVDGRMSGVTGLLVARRGDQYWLATTRSCRGVRGQSGDGRIFSVARKTVVAETIGAPVKLGAADDRARAILNDLIDHQPTPVGSAPALPTREDVAQLPAVVGIERCTNEKHKKTPAALLVPKIGLRMTAGDPRLLLLDATRSRGPIARYSWDIRPGPGPNLPHVALIRYRVPRGAGTAATVTLRLTGRAGSAPARAALRLQRPVVSTEWFHSGTARLTRAATRRLAAFADDLDPATIRRVYVEGHADTDGSERFNLQLSWRRARQVARALRRRLRLPAGTIVARGLGEQAPLATNETGAGRLANRVVEIMTVRAPGLVR